MSIKENTVSKKQLVDLAVALLVALLSLFGTMKIDLHLFESPCQSTHLKAESKDYKNYSMGDV